MRCTCQRHLPYRRRQMHRRRRRHCSAAFVLQVRCARTLGSSSSDQHWTRKRGQQRCWPVLDPSPTRTIRRKGNAFCQHIPQAARRRPAMPPPRSSNRPRDLRSDRSAAGSTPLVRALLVPILYQLTSPFGCTLELKAGAASGKSQRIQGLQITRASRQCRCVQSRHCRHTSKIIVR